MANLPINYPHIFDNKIYQVTEDDLITDDMENGIKGKLINNDVYLNERLIKAKEVLDTHTANADIHVTKAQKDSWNAKAGTDVASVSINGLMSKTDKSKLDTIAANAEVNQNAYTNVKVGSTTVAANSKTATFEIVQGTGVSITADNATKKITMSVPKVAELEQNIVTANNSIGTLSSLQTSSKSNIVSAVNECFTNANNGKQAFANVVGGSNTNTYAQLAANAQNIKNTRDNLQVNVNAGLVHLKNMMCITEPLTAEKVPAGILEANNRIVNLTTDRNNWMNLANSRKSILQTGKILMQDLGVQLSGSGRKTIQCNYNFGFIPSRLILVCRFIANSFIVSKQYIYEGILDSENNNKLEWGADGYTSKTNIENISQFGFTIQAKENIEFVITNLATIDITAIS